MGVLVSPFVKGAGGLLIWNNLLSISFWKKPATEKQGYLKIS